MHIVSVSLSGPPRLVNANSSLSQRWDNPADNTETFASDIIQLPFLVLPERNNLIPMCAGVRLFDLKNLIRQSVWKKRTAAAT